MTVIVSSLAVKENFATSLSEHLPITAWVTPRRIPDDCAAIVRVARQHGLISGNIVIITRYGIRSPAQFPPIYADGILTSLFFYKTHRDIAKWIAALRNYRHHPHDRAVVLAMMKPFYVKWANTVYESLNSNRYNESRTHKYFPENTTNVELGEELSKGCALGVYVGHGRSRGWSGYRGFRWKHIERFEQTTPIGAMISLSCSSLKQDKHESLPMGVQWVMDGRNCVFLGAADLVKIRPLEEITRILLRCLSLPSVKTIGELIVRMHSEIEVSVKPEVRLMWSRFRLIGNPLQLI